MKLILTLSLSSLCLYGCTTTHEFVITPIKDLPKMADGGKKTLKKSYTASVSTVSDSKSSPTKVPNRVEVYQIGPTLDLDGKLVKPYKLYRVVDTERVIFGSSKVEDPKIKPFPTKTKEQAIVQVIPPAPKDPAEESRKAEDALRNATATQGGLPQENAPQSDGIDAMSRKIVTDGFNHEANPETKPSEAAQDLQTAFGKP